MSFGEVTETVEARESLPQGVDTEAPDEREVAEELEIPDVVRPVDAKRHLRVLPEPLSESFEVGVGEKPGELDDTTTHR
jgi:hypothetical protein